MLSLPLELLIMGLLVLANGVLAMAETAVVSAKKTKLRKLAAKGDVGAGKALALAEQPARFLALVEFWLTLSGMLAGVLAGAHLAKELSAWIVATRPVLTAYADQLGLFVVTVGLTSFMLVFGELVPKRVGLAYPERVAALLAGTMRGLAWLAAPLLKFFEFITEILVKLLGLRVGSAADNVSEERVCALVEQGLHAGVFQRAEKNGRRRARAGPIACDAPDDATAEDCFSEPRRPRGSQLAEDRDERAAAFPVYQTQRDTIVGMVAVKALWAHSAIGLPTTLKNLLLPPLFVPETFSAIQLLERFKKTGKHIAVVTDEFGAVQGLVTLIDVLEAIVGDLPTPGDRAQPEAKQREDGSWLIDATLPTGESKTLLEP